MLSRKLASEGIYPAVDPLASSSNLLGPAACRVDHYRIAEAVRKTFARYRELQDIIAMLGPEELSQEDRLTGWRGLVGLQRFLTSAFLVTEAFYRTGRADGAACRDAFWLQSHPGGRVDACPSACSMVGALDEAKNRL